MITHQATYRVIYGDTDRMGVVYYANYLRLFEIGRAELFRSLGLTYKEIEERGYLLPLSEANCKYLSSARYDDALIIEASLDPSVKAGVKFNYTIYQQGSRETVAQGSTLHAFINGDGRVVRPPGFFKDLIKQFDMQG